MLSQINGHPLHYTILNTLMKSLLPHITKNQQWSKLLSQLAKVKNLFLIIENKFTKAKEGENKCPICQKFIYQANLFVLILHMEIEHEAVVSKRYYLIPEYDNEMVVRRYELTYDGFEIHLVKRASILEQGKKESSKKSDKLNNASSGQVQFSFQDFLSHTQTTTFLQSSIRSRNISLLQRIFSKFTKRLQTISTERKFYHSYNVYKTINPDSQNSDDQREQAIEKELQRLRINDFSDVSHWDKQLYLEWNSLVRKEKKELKVIEDVVGVAEKFVRGCKQKGIPKININMHLYTLWSVGRIRSPDMLNLSMMYENYKLEGVNNQENQGGEKGVDKSSQIQKGQMERE